MAALLTDASVRRDLRILLISEVGGVEAFAAAERSAKSSAERTMWEALRALEVKTRTAVYDNLGELAEQFATSERAAKLLGKASGVSLAVLPHRLQMHSLSNATKAFLPGFQKLHNHFRDTSLEPFFGFVVAHEKAIAEVGHRGLHDDRQRLDSVEALLQD